MLHAAQPAVVHLVHRADARCAAVDDAPTAVVLQVLADAGQIVHHVYAVLLQQRAGADAGKLQQLRRVDRAARQQHLASRTHLANGAVLAELDADRALAFGQDAMRQSADFHLQVGPVQHRLQIACRRGTAPPVAHCKLQRTDAFLLGAVEVGVVRIARLLRALDERVVQRMRRCGDRTPRAGHPCRGIRSRRAPGPPTWRKYGSTSSYDQPALPSWRHRSKSCFCPRI